MTNTAKILFLVDVTTDVPEKELDPEDREVAGLYGMELEEGDIDRTRKLEDGETYEEEAARDYFHRTVAIGVLDDFEITYRRFQFVEEIGDRPVIWI